MRIVKLWLDQIFKYNYHNLYLISKVKKILLFSDEKLN
jgi:hypothetical protein